MGDKELRHSVYAGLLARTYGLNWPWRRRVMKQILKLEGGSMFSATARELLVKHHGVRIGAYSYGECFIPGSFPPGVSIGRYVSIAEGVKVVLGNHPMNRRSMHPFFFNSSLGFVPYDNFGHGCLTIEHDAWIGCRAILAPGCTRVGIGAVVATGAVVTRDVPDFCVIGGVPAKPIRMRFPDSICQQLLKEAWWLRSIQELSMEMERFVEPIV